MNEPSVSIVIPVYNSASTLPKLVGALAALSLEGGCELILVNDGSKDGSGDVCWELSKTHTMHITVLDLSRNFGEHNAVMAGLHYARGQYVVVMDDDFQNPIEEIIRLLDYAKTSGLDVVYTYYEHKMHSMWRNAGSWFTNRVADFILDKPPGLYLSSFKCLNRFVVSQIVTHKGPFPYIDGLIFQITQRVGSIKVSHQVREQGESGYTIRKLLRLWMSMFVNFSVMPLRVSALLGVAIAFVGLAAAIPVVLEALMFSTPSGWGSIMASLLVFSGIQLIMLGVIGEYLGRTYLTLNVKPQFIVRRVNQGASNP